MCKVCRSTPCNPMCPNAPQVLVMGHCRACNAELRYDYTYFRDTNDDIFCSRECAELFHGITEEEWSID